MLQKKAQGNTYEIKKTHIGRIPYDSDLLEQINTFCLENNIKCGMVNIIGAVKRAKIGYYLQNEQSYREINDKNLDEGLEIVSCTGNISIKDTKPFAHLHAVFSDSYGNTYGGHLMPGTTIYAGEFIIQEFTGKELIRNPDETTKLPLWIL